LIADETEWRKRPYPGLHFLVAFVKAAHQQRRSVSSGRAAARGTGAPPESKTALPSLAALRVIGAVAVPLRACVNIQLVIGALVENKRVSGLLARLVLTLRSEQAFRLTPVSGQNGVQFTSVLLRVTIFSHRMSIRIGLFECA
jgi:hypothetical protein